MDDFLIEVNRLTIAGLSVKKISAYLYCSQQEVEDAIKRLKKVKATRPEKTKIIKEDEQTEKLSFDSALRVLSISRMCSDERWFIKKGDY